LRRFTKVKKRRKGATEGERGEGNWSPFLLRDVFIEGQHAVWRKKLHEVGSLRRPPKGRW